MEDQKNYKLYDYIIEKSKIFLMEGNIPELYRYLKKTGENFDDLIKIIEEKVEGEEEKKKLKLLKEYIEKKSEYQKKIDQIEKQTNQELFNILNDNYSGITEFLDKYMDVLDARELYKYLTINTGYQDINEIIKKLENINGGKYLQKLNDLKKYIEKKEKYQKRIDQIKKQTNQELFDIFDRFDQFGKLSTLFNDWKKNSELSFGEEYQKIFDGQVLEYNDNNSGGEISGKGNIGNEHLEESENLDTYHQHQYCLFNLIDNKGFTLSKFIKDNKTNTGEDKENLNNDLVNIISYMCLNNFCEQEEFYKGHLFNPSDIISAGGLTDIETIDFGKVDLLSPNSMTYEDCMQKIRNGIAHGDFHYLREAETAKIYINDRKGFEVLIEPSFFDEGFRLGQFISNVSCDFILGNNDELRVENIFEHKKKEGEHLPKMIKFLGSDFEQNLTEILDKQYNAVRINLNNKMWEKELEIINGTNTSENGLLFGLLSDNEIPYVHNLLNAVSISMLNKILQNPSITYDELSNDLLMDVVSSDWNIFTLQNKQKIVKTCLDMLPDLFMLQGLKAFYVDMLDIPSNNRTIEQKRRAHIRNALIHGYYKIVKGKLIIRDIDKKGNRITLDKDIYDIESLWKEAKEHEREYHSRENGFNSLKLGISIAKRER